jgi:hypothetical protein
LAQAGDDVLLTRSLKEAIDELDRAVKCREYAAVEPPRRQERQD